MKKIKGENVLFFIENEKEINNLKNIIIDKKILVKIKNIVKQKENQSFTFFIGGEIETLYIVYFNKDNGQDINDFLGKEFKVFPGDLTIVVSKKTLISPILNGVMLGRYLYQEFKTNKKIETINIITSSKELKKEIEKRIDTLNNVILARDLGAKPSNYLTPKKFTQIIKETKFKNTKVKIFDYKKIKETGLGLLEAVGKGSAHEPYMVILENKLDKKLPTLGLVGKGITFDTGGIQVKPGDKMYEMKGDMCGAADVFAIMRELDNKKLNINIIACLVIAENHISGNSYKPSDILKSYSGKTVEIIHTDAEGRLILADGISYLSKNYKLEKIVSIATLTGACMRALGYRYAGVLGNDEELINKLLKYSETNFEKYWRLPFDEYFIKKTEGIEADLRNLNSQVEAGTSYGAAFLSNFVLNNEKFTHIDIAGAAINDYEQYGYVNVGMTGFGVDSLSYILSSL